MNTTQSMTVSRWWAAALARVVVMGLSVVALWAGAARLAEAGSGLAPQSSRGGGVEVKVTPRTLAASAEVWEFEMTFDTHSVPLTGDPAQFSVLVDAQGREHNAFAWHGDPPGGHHRKGILSFKPLTGAAQVELRVNSVAGVPTRSFRWSVPQ